MPRPDRVIWMTTDHMRYDGIAFNGNPDVHTPALDALAAGGVSFDRCYGQNPLCMPSRASFMTGLYPQQTGVTANGHELHPDTETAVARCFKRGDYDAIQIGKLHFQNHEDVDMRAVASRDYGFDVMWLSEEPGSYEDAYMTWLRTEHPDLVETFRVPRSINPDRLGRENPVVLDAPWQASHTGWVVEQTLRYLSAFGGMRDSKFIHMGFYAPHPPLNPTREMMEPYEGREIAMPEWREGESADKPADLANMLRQRTGWTAEQFRQYRQHFYGMITGVDMAVARLVDHLQSEGLYENTLLVFSSDHGDMCADHRMTHKGPSFYDELMRLPLILHWPAGLGTEGRRVDGLVEMVDLLPTLLGLSGVRVPRAMSGRNYAPGLLDGAALDTRDDVVAYHEPGHLMLRTASHKYIRWASGAEVLYDLEADPHEFVNVAADGAYRDIRAAMIERAVARCVECSRSTRPKVSRF